MLAAEFRAWVVFISAFYIFCHISIRRKETRAESARNHDRPSASLRKQKKRAQKRSARYSRDGRRARLESGSKPQKNKSKPKQKSQMQQAARVRYAFHARRRKPTRNALSMRLFCVQKSGDRHHASLPLKEGGAKRRKIEWLAEPHFQHQLILHFGAPLIASF